MRSVSKIRVLIPAGVLAAVFSFALPTFAQVRPGPMPPPVNAPPTVLIDMNAKPDPPPIPAAEIVKRFSQNEDAIFLAHGNYGFHRTVRVQELDNTGKTIGEMVLSTDWVRSPDGRFYEKGEKHPDSTLRHLDLDSDHMDVLQKIPPLPFTTPQIAKYDFVYAGTQKLDELNTFIFRVEPKQVDRTHAYFSGVIWVDSQDFVIVKTTGRWQTELGDVSTIQFPFKNFDTYRENIEGKIWFPNYMRSDEYISTKTGMINVRLTVRWENYKPREAAATAAPGSTN
jgi:hypothetical protein